MPLANSMPGGYWGTQRIRRVFRGTTKLVGRINLTPDPRAKTILGANNTIAWRNDRWGAEGAYTLISGIAGPVPGVTTAIRKTMNASITPGHGGFNLASNPENASIGAGNGFAVTAGVTYTVSAYARTSASSKTCQIQVRYYDAAGNALAAGINGTGAAMTPNTWVRTQLVTTVAPAGAVRMAAMLSMSGSTNWANGDTFDGTALLVESNALGAAGTVYADGSYAGWGWDGTPDASTSSGWS